MKKIALILAFCALPIAYSSAYSQTEQEVKEYVAEVVRTEYGLKELSDKNRNPDQIKKFKVDFAAKVKSQLKPEKIFGTYSTSFAWQGLYLVNKPELNAKYSSVQEMQFKTYYQKDGKYYIIKGAFRNAIDKDDYATSGGPIDTYWPGLEIPVEIPEDVFKKYIDTSKVMEVKEEKPAKETKVKKNKKKK